MSNKPFNIPSSNTSNTSKGGPFYVVKGNSPDLDEGTGHHVTNPSWLVAFVRYEQPASFYTSQSQSQQIVASDPMLIENDCVSVQISNAKASHLKTCVLTLKAGEVYYPYAVRPGDWVLVWLADELSHIDELISRIKGFADAHIETADFDSGLKFVGRVSGVSTADRISEHGTKTITQSVACTSFLELDSSIYYSDRARTILGLEPQGKDAKDPNRDRVQDQQQNIDANVQSQLMKKYPDLYKEYTDSLKKRSGKAKSGSSPDRIVGLITRIVLGIDSQDNALSTDIDIIRGSFNDAIIVPAPVARMMGRPNVRKLWELYKVYLGVQQYSNSGGEPWNSFLPIGRVSSDGVYRYSEETDGSVQFHAPLWSNRSIWSILNDYRNPAVNEMFTSLRITGGSENGKGLLSPTITFREYPFSTGLYNGLTNPDKIIEAENRKKRGGVSVSSAGPRDELNRPRTYFGNLPRWIIHPSMLADVSVGTSEADRINMVQVWGKGINTDLIADVENDIRSLQQQIPNWYMDQNDVRRHGLRADIAESSFDAVTSTGTRVGVWAAKRADWMFNGHLKLKGTITCKGIQEPIAEGDNLEVEGILYHIEAVTHSASISPNGEKRFETSIAVSRGVIASSLNDPKAIPQYAYQFSHLTQSLKSNTVPGLTDIQDTIAHGHRDSGGEKYGEGSSYTGAYEIQGEEGNE